MSTFDISSASLTVMLVVKRLRSATVTSLKLSSSVWILSRSATAAWQTSSCLQASKGCTVTW